MLSTCCNAASTEANVELAFVTLVTSTFEIAVPESAALVVAAVKPELPTVPPMTNEPPSVPA